MKARENNLDSTGERVLLTCGNTSFLREFDVIRYVFLKTNVLRRQNNSMLK